MVTASPTPTSTPIAPETDSPVIPAPNRNKFRLAGDVVRNAIADLPDEQRSLAWWFSQWIAKHIQNKSELGAVLRKSNGEYYSPDSIIQLLTGGRIRRGENVEPILDAIAKLRKVEDLRAEQITSGFIQTRLYTEISRRCQKALKRQRIQYIFGDSQIGKTTCLKEYARTHNHGETVYIELPAGGSLGGLLQQMAEHYNIPSVMKHRALCDRVIECVDANQLLIFDEFHNCLRGKGNLTTVSFVRELWNRKHPGMVISMTNEGRDSLIKGPNAKALEQMWRRRITPLQLPNVTPEDDLALFASAYGLPPADEEEVSIRVTYYDSTGKECTRTHKDAPLRLQREVVQTEGLGVWIGILQDAADMAQEQRKPITWGAVIKAACQAQADAEILN
jgi:hypothetical protein